MTQQTEYVIGLRDKHGAIWICTGPLRWTHNRKAATRLVGRAAAEEALAATRTELESRCGYSLPKLALYPACGGNKVGACP